MLRAAYFIALSVSILVAAWNGAVQEANLRLGDILMAHRGPVRSPSAQGIVLLAIDDRTAERHGPLPLKRSVLASGLERVAGFEPRLIGIDLLLAEPGPDDAALGKALGGTPHVTAAALASDPGPPRWIWPLPELAGSRVGHVHAEPDADGVVRSVLLEKRAAGRSVRAFGAEIAGRPVRDDGKPMRINFAGAEGAFRRVSFADVLEGRTSPEVFSGGTVILGVTAQGAGDRYFTPLSTGGTPMSGIEIHAHVARTILDGAFLIPLGLAGEMAAFVLIAGACLAALRLLRGLRLALALAAILAALPAVCRLALGWNAVWPLASFVAVFAVSAAAGGAAQFGILASALRRADQQRREYAFRVQAVAHEIKTPLTAIQGSSEMIAGDLLPEAARAQMAGLIHRESKRLTGIIQTFLTVERISSGSLGIRKRPVRLDQLCADVVDRARLYAARKAIEVRADVEPLEIEADADLLAFAVYNLLTNAVKYSPRETVVRLETAETAGTVSLSVTDEGHGIAPAEQQRIFDRFYRMKRDRQGAEPGSGIGLALVREIVAQHGGRIEVDSKPGQGSRFTLVFWKNPPSS